MKNFVNKHKQKCQGHQLRRHQLLRVASIATHHLVVLHLTTDISMTIVERCVLDITPDTTGIAMTISNGVSSAAPSEQATELPTPLPLF